MLPIPQTTAAGGGTRVTMAHPTRAAPEGTATRAGMATRAHGRAAHPTTRGGTTRPTRDGTPKEITTVAPQTAGGRDPTTSATTTARVTAAAQ